MRCPIKRIRMQLLPDRSIYRMLCDYRMPHNKPFGGLFNGRYLKRQQVPRAIGQVLFFAHCVT